MQRKMGKSQSMSIKLSLEYVQAILAGRKTMHRIPIRPQPIIDEDSGYVFSGNHKKSYKNDAHHPPWQQGFMDDFYPFVAGDILWVKETWMHGPNAHAPHMPAYNYRASESKQFLEEWPGCWSPCTTMPIDAARIFLKVNDVFIKRLQDITEEDAVKEGVEMTCNGKHLKQWRIYTSTFGFQANTALWSYKSLWEKIHGIESWDSNPWVWVFTFDVLSTNGERTS